jgi:protein-S-isoprenylcysteine O-methyltransferase
MNPARFSGIALIAFGATEFFMRKGQAAKSFKRTAADRGTTPLIFGCYAMIVALFFVPSLPGPIAPRWLRWAGAVVAYAGLALRWWAMAVLGRFYTRTLTTTAEHTVVTSGPYRFIRHPGYLGSLLTWAGAAAAQGRILLWPLIVAVLVGTYAWRIASEESMLVGQLGRSYKAYQERSWRLLPFVF